ncbi:class I SAM-dependent methyltransferase [Burkholderia pseudomultivorans]|uniref:Aklanonic acid methyltransferase DauC n=1 Tax=Burkholderia pseudomultivorans TaxID=1207504 RepID=A0A6P2GQT4_9BURK|nr:class I SAM-dependent methyltransferase [Burkholderia pseudomultivorans]MDR8728956.1 Aklanonic acid methyltransferase DauC [Burkholderia pseudomultivorans]MDR8732686.1 Aklanonic acid methyltransferase DauC [Burkholderia pseudomultivorans]MDR8739552.1 Aklanonic acid methyltransferase DauC [Burkholderia pseudomultivorans]MDR8752830.1 Aklanonic acid methyltransferase DauC [Burkholderia pseudomultivorans]MDR8778117.1 Aklanonic acid methyltransferase DauC [Burkholderia pseudomultivorans]
MEQAQPNEEQSALWNGPSGRAWVDIQAPLDRMFEPVGTLLADTAAASSARSVLDVGCGTGAVTLAIARRLGADAQCTGVDISARMIDAAHARAQRSGLRVRFVCADAQTHAFAPASVDLIVSRFGVMFFDDPVRAFANLRRAARIDAELRFVAWRSALDNLFMTTAERAAAPLLPDLPPRRPGAPGQFAFGDRQRIASVLSGSGWADIAIEPVDIACALPEPAPNDYIARLGPVGLALQQVDDATRRRVVETVRTAFEPYVQGADVRFDAACWLVTARVPSAVR